MSDKHDEKARELLITHRAFLLTDSVRFREAIAAALRDVERETTARLRTQGATSKF